MMGSRSDAAGPRLPSARLSLVLGLVIGVAALVADRVALYWSDAAAVAGVRSLVAHVTALLPALVPLLAWPFVAQQRPARQRLLIALSLVAAWCVLAFEVVPRLTMAMLLGDLPDFGVIGISRWHSATWTTTGFIEYSPLAEPGVLRHELLRRGMQLALLLVSLLPVASERLGRTAGRFALAATLGALGGPYLVPGGFLRWLAPAAAVLGCMVLAWWCREPAGAAPDRRPSAWAQLAAALGCLGFGYVIVVEWCRIGAASSDLFAWLGL